MSALQRIWAYMNKNNGHLQDIRSLSAMFFELHKAGILHGLIQKAFELEYEYGHIEFATRGLYWEKVDWKDKKLGHITTTFHDNFKIVFHNDADFTKKNQNGEHVFLNMQTGECGVF